MSEIKLSKPYVKVIRNEDETYNFSDLLEETSAETAAAVKKSQPLQFSINNITVSDGSMDFLDAPEQVFHEVMAINFAVPFVSNMRYYAQSYIQPRFSALVNGDSFTIEGRTKPFAESLETEFDININDLDLADYLGYVPNRKKFNLLSGALDLTAKLVYIQDAAKGPDLTVSGKLTLKNINLADEKKNPLFNIAEAAFEIASVKPFEDSIHLSSVDVRAPEINMRRNKDGTLDLLNVFSPFGPELQSKREDKPGPSPG